MAEIKNVVQAHVQNFETLRRAFKAKQTALMEVKVAATGEVVAAVCTVSKDKAGMITMTPFCTFLNGNPFELLIPPDPDRPGKFMGEE